MQQAMPIFIVTGTPGSGKSSVARALMRRFELGLHIPVDDLRELVVSGIAHPVPDWTEETGRQFSLARRAATQMARLYAEAGFAVAIDDVIFPAEARSLRSETLEGLLVHQVLLYPSLDVALERSASRALSNSTRQC
jgi:chloramphenicol 3-O-phosphotransferase